MAWTNLKDLLSDEGVLDGTIPDKAVCRVIAGDKTTKKKKKQGLKILVKKMKNRLLKLDGKKMTVSQFCKKCEAFMLETEWTFTPNGRLVHYRGPINKNGKMVWTAVVQLDLKGWLREQDEDTINKLAKVAFLWKQDGGRAMAVKFYERLRMAVPEELIEKPPPAITTVVKEKKKKEKVKS